MVKALVISGYGINCEREMALAAKSCGADTAIVHSHKILNPNFSFESYHLLLFPGGFSFGDDLGAGKALANRMTYATKMKEKLEHFVAQGGCILGVCNGFQLLVKLGLLPGFTQQNVSLTHNNSGRFENRWAHHYVCDSPSIFTQGLSKLYLPVRHGQGKFIVKEESVLKSLIEQNQLALRYSNQMGKPTDQYPDNPNGSVHSIAGICDKSGRILGMMAHPEAALKFENHPSWTKIREQHQRSKTPIPKYGDGIKLFQNAVNYIKENL